MTTHEKAPLILRLDMTALAKNYAFFQSLGAAHVGAAVKADGYGLGATYVTKALYHAGCRHFFVATVQEALTLQHAKVAPDALIFVLGGLESGDEAAYRSAHPAILPVLNSMAQLIRWKNTHGVKRPCAVQVDTGMNRLGLRPEEATPDTLSGLDIRLLLSHFSCADEKNHPMNEAQAMRFADIATRFPDIPKSLCNSSGALRNKDWHYDILRPGYGLYGGNPTPETRNPMAPVIHLQARILQVRDVKAGESAGYGAKHIFTKDARIATVAIGYADGLPRAGSGRVIFYTKDGQPCPAIGRISMDVTMVDLSGLASPPAEGDYVDIISPHQDVDRLATACGTIGYEILTSLSHRAQRVYEGLD